LCNIFTNSITLVSAWLKMHLFGGWAALDAVRQVRVCDPACGSGAYLLGMLQEMLNLRAGLFAARSVDATTTYNRKLEIIQGSLYGVDKDAFAVNIARLRLWLSLVVEYEGDEPPPLPNLDYKIGAVGYFHLTPPPYHACTSSTTRTEGT
jgi:hypothetical protein